MNDADFAGFTARVARSLLGDAAYVEMPAPIMGAEDFSYVLRERPGVMAFLGTCPQREQPLRAHSCHSNRMTIDEDAMQAGIAMHCALAERFLEQRAELA